MRTGVGFEQSDLEYFGAHGTNLSQYGFDRLILLAIRHADGAPLSTKGLPERLRDAAWRENVWGLIRLSRCFAPASLPELFKILAVAGRAMRYVLPLWIIFNSVVEILGPDRQRDDTLVAGAARALRVGVSLYNAFLNLALNPIPLLFRRFPLHPPEHYREVTGLTPPKLTHSLIFSTNDRSGASQVPPPSRRCVRQSPATSSRAGAIERPHAFQCALRV